ncbi:unnamed protein product [Gadus morhua 'NCC']
MPGVAVLLLCSVSSRSAHQQVSGPLTAGDNLRPSSPSAPPLGHTNGRPPFTGSRRHHATRATESDGVLDPTSLFPGHDNQEEIIGALPCGLVATSRLFPQYFLSHPGLAVLCIRLGEARRRTTLRGNGCIVIEGVGPRGNSQHSPARSL